MTSKGYVEENFRDLADKIHNHLKNLYGIWNSIAKEFQFGICEPTKKKAIQLFNKIGRDAYKWRFEVRKLDNKM